MTMSNLPSISGWRVRTWHAVNLKADLAANPSWQRRQTHNNNWQISLLRWWKHLQNMLFSLNPAMRTKEKKKCIPATSQLCVFFFFLPEFVHIQYTHGARVSPCVAESSKAAQLQSVFPLLFTLDYPNASKHFTSAPFTGLCVPHPHKCLPYNTELHIDTSTQTGLLSVSAESRFSLKTTKKKPVSSFALKSLYFHW